MLKVRGDVQHYAWGDGATIPQLLGQPADDQPWAELWLGTHPLLPSRVRTSSGVRPLREVSGRLPFLLKVLASSQPLSLQTHPDEDQAEAGFAREERSGLPLDHPTRIYRDKDAKPEILCAMTTFEALAGFRLPQESFEMLMAIGGAAGDLAAQLQRDGLGATVRHLLANRPDIATALGDACRQHEGRDVEHARWISKLATKYPNDPAVAVAALMNFVVLRPGEALYLKPGGLHSYLRGAGVELMRSSDNVIRAGFTPKPIYPDELLATLDLSAGPPPRAEAQLTAPGLYSYDTPGSGFQLWRIELEGQITLSASYGPELLLCVNGDAGSLAKGEACFVKAGETYSLAGKATIYRATNGVFEN
jgi:mannose-6-phosphate isomerase